MGDGAGPGIRGGWSVIVGAGVVVECVGDAFVDVEAVALVGSGEKAGGDLHVAGEVAVGLAVDAKDWGLDASDVFGC